MKTVVCLLVAVVLCAYVGGFLTPGTAVHAQSVEQASGKLVKTERALRDEANSANNDAAIVKQDLSRDRVTTLPKELEDFTLSTQRLAGSSSQLIFDDLVTQSVAADAEDTGSLRLIVFGLPQSVSNEAAFMVIQGDHTIDSRHRKTIDFSQVGHNLTKGPLLLFKLGDDCLYRRLCLLSQFKIGTSWKAFSNVEAPSSMVDLPGSEMAVAAGAIRPAYPGPKRVECLPFSRMTQ